MASISIFLSLLLFSYSQANANYGGGSDSDGDNNGFTTSLIHRDSLLHNPSLSRYDRLARAFRRSFSRSATLLRRTTAVSTTSIHSPITPDDGEFLMTVSIGTPPVDFIAIADTGSDLTWTQCLPCNQCFNQSLPIFNPRHSSSYRRVHCTSNACHSLESSRCGPVHRTCSYGYGYGDGSFTYGDLASDKITIGSFELRKTIIGCGHRNGGTFGGVTSGIIGLGGGPLSLVSQMRKTGHVKRQFSYCLPSFFDDNANVTGKISFGRSAVVSGRKAVSTPFVAKYPDTFYYLTLEAMSVANKRIEAADSKSAASGNIIIDSGTTLTLLPPNLHHGVVSTLKSVIRGKRVDDPFGMLELCYAVSNNIDNLNIPIITAHFGGNATVDLLPLNTFALVADDVACLTLAPSSNVAIFGNLAQINFLVGYDLERKRLSFKHSICA